MSDVVSQYDFAAASRVFCKSHAHAAPLSQDMSRDHLFTGSLKTYNLSSGVQLCTASMTALRDSQLDAVFPKSICMVVSLAGRSCEINSGGRITESLNHHDSAFFCFDDECMSSGRYDRGQSSTSVLIQLRPELLVDPDLQDVVEKHTKINRIERCGRDRRISGLGAALFAPQGCNTVAKLMIECYAMELVARFVGLLDEVAEDTTRLSHCDLAKMKLIREMMTASPETCYTMTQLAKEVGMSVSSLKSKFQQAFGVPVFTCLRDIRLDRAHEGILRDGWTVKQAAYFSGYKHAANFSTAFARKFGTPPSLFRGD